MMASNTKVATGKKLGVLAAALAAIGVGGNALAFEIDTGSDVKVRWDNTVKYSAMWRVKSQDSNQTVADNMLVPPFFPVGAQLDDGDRNFDRGQISNRVDLFSEFDVAYKNMGFRASAAAWYDTVYNHGNDNSATTFPPGVPWVNSTSVGAGDFTTETERLMGRKAEFLDAFVYIKNDPSSQTPFTVRAGKHTVLYGESLFFGANGIAYAQAPMDMIKLLQVPGSQFKEIIRPVPQVSTQVQLTNDISVGAYVQTKFEAMRIPPSGSYLSDADFAGEGADSLLGMAHVRDIKAKDSGQGGVQLRFTKDGVDYGLYAARYHDKGPQFMLDPVGGKYRAVYAENVNTFGASFSTVFGETNVAGEASIRTNAPLVSDPQVDIGLLGNGGNNRLFAVGKTAHLQASFITLFPRNGIWDGAAWLGEIAWNRRLSIDKNPGALAANTTRDAWAIRTIFEPQFFQVVPGVDVTVPIGLGYNPSGRSSAVFKFNGGVEKGGDFSIGVTADYQKQYKAAINYVRFFGPNGAFLEPNAAAPFQLSYDQSLRDRDFISFSIQTSF